MKRALISVSDKTGIIDFARFLEKSGYQLISTSGTEKILKENGLSPINISEITNFPEIMDGRVKTLHPNIHGALLCVRDNLEHIEALSENNILPIDLVVVNLYPFKEVLERNSDNHDLLIENIDIGGPSMLRSSAKNYKFITVCCDPLDYQKVKDEIESSGETTLETREYLAAKVFRHTSSYDTLIGEYLTKKTGELFPVSLTLTYEKVQDLRYGENPHQKGAFYKLPITGFSLADAKQLSGKELSFNNIQDVNAALEILREFHSPTVVAVKHMNPCGVGTGDTALTAWKKAYEADPISIFGGIIAFNCEVDTCVAQEIKSLFLEIVIAPSFTDEALSILKQRKNLRVLTLDINKRERSDFKITSISDGILIQNSDTEKSNVDYKCVTDKKPSDKDIEALKFLFKIVKHVKSNGIVVGDNTQTFGIGAGQTNRIGAAKIALEQAGLKASGYYLASDAFLPMDDTVILAAKYGIKAIIQPGGSIKDEDSIRKCNEYGISMIFTGVRHFKH